MKTKADLELIKNIAKKVSDFLYANGYNGTIYFEHNSYDLDEDIPRFGNDKVSEIRFTEKGDFVEIICTHSASGIDFNDLNGINEDEYNELYAILSETYYNTSESWEIGDFEMDFLGL